MTLKALTLAALIGLGAPALAAEEEVATAPLPCDQLGAIDEAREASTEGFERIYAAISTMTTAGFCGETALEEKVDARIRAAIDRYDARQDALSAEEQLTLKQVKASYVLGRQMIDRSN